MEAAAKQGQLSFDSLSFLPSAMDVDIPEENGQSSSQYIRRPHFVPVDDAHPFELDGYISNYTGKILGAY
jgi:hypothetical protein